MTAAERVLEREERLQHELELAFAFLGRRERTVVELCRCLERRGVDSDTARRAADVLVEQGYLDDARYAQRFAQDKRELEQWGTERIGQGRSNAKAHLVEHPDVAREIEDKIYEALGIDCEGGAEPPLALAEEPDAEAEEKAA